MPTPTDNPAIADSKLQPQIPFYKPVHPRLTLVGAGIGDPELITLKAVKALQGADAVIYDALVNEELLNYAPPGAIKLYAGKRKSEKAFSQEEINERIVVYAKSYGHVVRLKGGDPFVFGRGLEEIEYARAWGLEVEYIPGVSSSIAGAGAAGIAVTSRGASRGFWVLTATTETGELNPEIIAAAHSNATVVVLMGITKLGEIALAFIKAGKAGLPMAIIQNATLPHQMEVVGTPADIAAKASLAGVGSPAVIILGEVVAHRVLLNSASKIASRWHG